MIGRDWSFGAVRINFVKRAANFRQLDYYSEGSILDALIGVPNGWTPDQIRQFQDCCTGDMPPPFPPPQAGEG